MEWIDEFLSDEPEKCSANDEFEIECLIDGASISPEEKAFLYAENSSGLPIERYKELRAYLIPLQVQPITHSRNYSAKDIINHLKRII